LQSEQIPLAARLIAVVDSYTVMITDRPYQLARSPAVALVELQRCAGSQFDPRVVEALTGLLQGTQDQSQHEVASVAWRSTTASRISTGNSGDILDVD